MSGMNDADEAAHDWKSQQCKRQHRRYRESVFKSAWVDGASQCPQVLTLRRAAHDWSREFKALEIIGIRLMPQA
jgi:hypothetical protein